MRNYPPHFTVTLTWPEFLLWARIRLELKFSKVWNYSALAEECLTCNLWSPLAELWAEIHWAE